MVHSTVQYGPMDSNHGNLYNELLVLVLGLYGVIHAEVNILEVGVGNRRGNGVGRCGQDGKGKTGEGRGRCAQERSEGEGYGM